MNIKLYRWTEKQQNKLSPEARALVFLAESGTARWTGPYDFLIDSGASTTVLPNDLVTAVCGKNIKIISTEKHEMADGSVIDVQRGLIDIAVICLSNYNSVGFLEVPISIYPKGTQPLLGMDLLRFFNLVIIGGKFQGFEPNSMALLALKSMP